jgi:hypothetical protein
MDEIAPTPEDFREFRDSLTRSGRLASIDVAVSAAADELRLDVVYRFEETSAPDGRIIGMGFSPACLELSSIEASGARVWDPESDDFDIPAKPRGLAIEPESADGWAGVSLRARFNWAASATADATPLLMIPNALPLVMNALVGVERVRLPELRITLDASAESCLAAWTIDGSEWPDGSHPERVLQAVFVHPNADSVRLRQLQDWCPAPSCTSGVSASVTEAERDELNAVTVFAVATLPRLFGVRAVARVLLATTGDLRCARGEMASVVSWIPGKDARSPGGFIRVAMDVSRSWWGTGLLLVGPNATALQEALRMSVAARWLQGIVDARVDPAKAIAHALSLPPGEPDLVPAMSLAASLVEEMTPDEGKRDSFREFTRDAWGYAVPEQEFIDWCLGAGIHVPAEFRISHPFSQS